MVNSLTSSCDGSVYIKSSINSSIIDLRALAPVFLLKASLAIASTDAGSKFNSTLSILNKVLNCFTRASLGSVRIDSRVSLVRRSNTAHTGILPMNSGINPYLTRSSSSKFLRASRESTIFFGFTTSSEDSKVDAKKIVDPRNALKNLELDDLVKYGLIPEFIGRIPVCAVLDRLTKETLESILTEPRDSLVKQFKTLLSMDNVELNFEPESVEAIANEAFKRKTGARALRSIIEELMLDLMYTLPSQEEVKEFTITKKMVDKLFLSKIVKLPAGSTRVIKETA